MPTAASRSSASSSRISNGASAVSPNFHFHLADLANTTYNRGGAATAATYRFPPTDESVDRVRLRSLFTHLVPVEAENYLHEISPVLNSGGRSYITWFLLDDVSRPSVRRAPGEPSHPLLRVDHGVYWVKSDESPAAAVAFEEDWVRAAYERHGLRVLEPVLQGA